MTILSFLHDFWLKTNFLEQSVQKSRMIPERTVPDKQKTAHTADRFFLVLSLCL